MNLMDSQNVGLAQLISQQRAPSSNVRIGADEPSIFHLISPREVTNKMRALDAEFSTLDASVKSQPPGAISPAFLNGWNAELAAWRAFMDQNSSELRMVVTGTGTLSRQIDQYRNNLIGWNQSFRQQFPQASTVGPPPAPITPPKPVIVEKPGLPWWVVSLFTLAAVGGLAYAGYSAYRYAKSGASILQYVRGKGTSRDDVYENDGEESHRRMMQVHLPYPSCQYHRRLYSGTEVK